ncbi:MAG: ketoacyl-ACP synthase III [Candidatus Gastranaerophilales bacterium]|nr:ketoacyl-ACP synthase III [Candidatus Gastranaerophilales bacterium]
MAPKVKIAGLGKALPETYLTNFDMAKLVETDDEWISTRTGIKERRVLAGDERLSELAHDAAVDAIIDAKIDKNDIDMIIVATSVNDSIYPNLASEVQSMLGIERHIPCFDMAVACTGAIYAMNTARAYIQSGMYKTILVIGADAHSRFVDWTDRNTCIIFGDGAGAMILQASDNFEGILSMSIHADGSRGQELTLPMGTQNSPLVAQKEVLPQHLYMNGKEIYKFVVNTIPDSILSVVEQAGLTIGDIDYLVLHQANVRIIKAVQERLGFHDGQVFHNLHKYGNTSAASIFVALTEAFEMKEFERPCTIAISGFGAGLAWGSGILRFD